MGPKLGEGTEHLSHAGLTDMLNGHSPGFRTSSRDLVLVLGFWRSKSLMA